MKANVLWILADQLRPQALECYGDENAATPHINRLAREGALFTNAYANYPLCCPARASLLTGCHPWETGVIGHAYRMRSDIRTIADSFNDAGYDTCYIGKWHLDGQPGENRPVFGRRGGFKYFKGFEVGNDFFATKIFDEDGKDLGLSGYQSDVLTDLAIDMISSEHRTNAPFFMVLSLEPPHIPNVAPDDNMQKYSKKELKLRLNVPQEKIAYTEKALRGYYAQIDNIDFNIGRIIERLDKENILENTMVVFLSDHGDMIGSHGLYYKQWPYDEATRIPLIIRYPHKIAAKTATDMMLTNLDVYPMMLGLAGIKENSLLAGKDLSECIVAGKTDSRKGIAIASVIPTVWTKDKYCRHSWRVYITKDYKLAYKPGEFWHLFDRNNDPFEMNNLIADPAFRNIRHQLTLEFREYLWKAGDGFQLPRI